MNILIVETRALADKLVSLLMELMIVNYTWLLLKLSKVQNRLQEKPQPDLILNGYSA